MLPYRKRYGVSIPPLPFISVILLCFVDSVTMGAQTMIMIVQIVGMRRYIWLLLWLLHSHQRPVFLDLLCCLQSLGSVGSAKLGSGWRSGSVPCYSQF